MRRYNPKDIEPKWQKVWEEQGIYRASEDPAKPKRYILEYFPYPSGAAMHVGHVRNYTIGDALARFGRMRGQNVLHPMGWDAFGLPAENYAIKTGTSPRKAIDDNTTRFKAQLIQMGFGYDWSREIDSTDPQYYRWTQWFFNLLFKRGLAYQQESLQWWCPHDKTVLANEQVEAGKCWRCGNDVEKKALKQWFFKITDYADRLAKDLDDVDWSDSIKNMQRNWIGRSKGAEITFRVASHQSPVTRGETQTSDKRLETSDSITVFTTRPDTLFGATFMVLSPEHPLVSQITTESQKRAVEEYKKAAQAKSDIERQETDREKTGVFTGAYAINPVNDEKIPIWVADYVLMGYGTGAIMAVPAHDQRDYEFASKFNLPVKYVIEPITGENIEPELQRESIVAIIRNPSDDKFLSVKWRHSGGWHLFVGGGIDENEDPEAAALREIAEETGYYDLKLIKKLPYRVNHFYYSLIKDQNREVNCTILFFELQSEQQREQKLEDYEKDKFDIVWLKPNEVENYVKDELHAWSYKALVKDEVYTGEGRMINSGEFDGLSSSDVREIIVKDLAEKSLGKERINYKMRDWLISRQRYWGAPIPIVHCPKDGAVAVPDDQLPVVLPELESFQPSGDGRSPLANVPEFIKTTCPQCGGPAERETDTMDGFACSSWYFLRFADPHNDQAAFSKDKAEFWLPVDDYIGGAEHAVMHLLYARFWTKVMFDEGLITFQEPFKTLRNHGMILAPDGQKMSKSKGNTIEPDGLIDQGYGADSIRLMELFIGPWNQEANWSIEGMGGTFRFLQRVWTLALEYSEAKTPVDNPELQVLAHRTIERVSRDLEELGFNTAISAMMEYVNELYKHKVQGIGGSDWQFAIETLIKLLAPFAPHITEELWQVIGQEGSVHTSAWPVHDEKMLVSDTVTIVVQVNGKVRANISVATDSDEKTVVQAAKNDAKIKAHLSGEPKKTIYVPGINCW